MCHTKFGEAEEGCVTRLKQTIKRSIGYLEPLVILRSDYAYIPYLISSARAIIPAARGADAEVPVCLSVHTLCKSVVT